MSGNAFAGGTAEFCSVVGSLAQSVTKDRDRGVSYNDLLAMFEGMTLDTGDSVLIITKFILKTIYFEMPNLTPESASQHFYSMCVEEELLTLSWRRPALPFGCVSVNLESSRSLSPL